MYDRMLIRGLKKWTKVEVEGNITTIVLLGEKIISVANYKTLPFSLPEADSPCHQLVDGDVTINFASIKPSIKVNI